MTASADADPVASAPAATPAPADGPLQALAALLREEGGLVADVVPADPRVGGHDPGYGRQAAGGPRTVARAGDYALLVEAIREGYLQHYGEGRVVATDDRDLALLAGDRLYALGLARLAELGDLEAVGILADVISSSAQVHAEDRPQDAEAVWVQGVAAVAGDRQTHH